MKYDHLYLGGVLVLIGDKTVIVRMHKNHPAVKPYNKNMPETQAVWFK